MNQLLLYVNEKKLEDKENILRFILNQTIVYHRLFKL